MFIIHTDPKQSTETYIEAYQIAKSHYDKTNEHIAVVQVGGDERSGGLDIISFPSEK
mgnify:CR=1 FL=1|jgi:hypothetical protein